MAEWKDRDGFHTLLLAGTFSVRVREDALRHDCYRIFVHFSGRDLPTPTTLADAKAEALAWARELLTTALAELDAPQADGWQPMKTAPKDGTHIHLGYAHQRGFDVIAFWKNGEWWISEGVGTYGRGEPAAWRPLPNPPQGKL